MIAILTIIFSAASTLLLWLCLGKLKVIARDTSSREELADTIEKFAALAGDRKGKVVAFRAKPKDDDGE
jgi:hypothetical protein